MIIPEQPETAGVVMQDQPSAKESIMSVKLIKLAALTGRTVKIHDKSECKVPYYFRVNRVEPARINETADGDGMWWLYGERVTADGRPAKRQLHTAQFVDLANILDVR